MKKISTNTIVRLAQKLYKKWNDFEQKYWYIPDSMSETLYWVKWDMIFRTWEDTLKIYETDSVWNDSHIFDIVFSATQPNLYIYEFEEDYVQRNILLYDININKLIEELQTI